MKIDLETKGFLKREARIAFKALTYVEQRQIRNYKPIFREMCEAWRAGATIDLPKDYKAEHRKMKPGDEVEDNLALHKLYGDMPELEEGQIAFFEKGES